jgi:hypothetical protein
MNRMKPISLSHMRNHYYTPLLALVSLCWCVFVPSLNAQQLDVQEWPNGQVILATGDTLYGSVVYYQTEEVIRLIRQDGTNQAFAPVGVQSFTVTDHQSQYHKVFRSGTGEMTIPTIGCRPFSKCCRRGLTRWSSGK